MTLPASLWCSSCLVVAAAEVVVGLGIIVSIFRHRPGVTADDLHILKG